MAPIIRSLEERAESTLARWGTAKELSTELKPFFRQSQLPLHQSEWYKASSVYSVKNRIERPPSWAIGKRPLDVGEQLAFPSVVETDPIGKRILARKAAHNVALDHLTFRK